MAEACALLGTGCRERKAGGEVALEFWLAPAAAPAAAALEAELARRGHRARVRAEPQDGAWREAMRAFHRPITVGRLHVRPPWCPAVEAPGLLDVVIEPGMAFGTGQHATTRGCLALLSDLEPGSLVDVGTGSGVLAVAARRLGFDPVWALDRDPLAVAATIANARRNGVGLRVGLRTVGADPLPPAETVVANLTAELLGVLAGALAAAPPRRVVASGLRDEERPAVERALAPLGLETTAAVSEGGWTALLAERG